MRQGSCVIVGRVLLGAIVAGGCGADSASTPPGSDGSGATSGSSSGGAPTGGSAFTGGTGAAATGGTAATSGNDAGGTSGDGTGGRAGTSGAPSGGGTSGAAGSGGLAASGGSSDTAAGASGGSGGTSGAPSGGAAGLSGSSGSSAAGGPSGSAASSGDAGAGTGGSAGTGGATGTLDVFGIEQLYPSAPSGAEWTSEHWSGGTPYSIDSRTDPNDPLGISGMRGTGTLDVTGDGELVMGGSQPRIYVYPGDAGPWRDVEVTAYYMRVADDATAWGGLSIGTRSGPEGHATEVCDAYTYYARLRHDGAIDFVKELMHSPSTTQARIEPEVVWPPDGNLPFNAWIGFKFVIFNLSPGAVKLETYRDLTQGENGGDWVMMSEYVEDGGWFTQTTCEEHNPVNGESDMDWEEGGCTFIRNTGVTEAHYRWVTIREIAP